MGKLGVREKSLIHQVNTPPTPTVPGFGTSFLPFGVDPADDPEQGVPGGTNNFNAVQLTPSAGSLWLYKAKTTATSGYPGDGYMLWDNATQTSATNLIFSHLTTDDLDIDLVLATIASGNTLIVQDANDSLNSQKWTVSGSPTNTNPGTATSYWTVPVTLVSSAGTGTTGFPNNHQLIVLRPGGGGGSTTTNVTNNYIVTTDPQDDPEPPAPETSGFLGSQLDAILFPLLDRRFGTTAGTVVVRESGTAWGLTGLGNNQLYLDSTGAFSNPNTTGAAGWQSAFDIDFSALSNLTLSPDGNYSVGGLTWTKTGSAKDSVAMAIVNGSGLVIQPATSATYSGNTRNGPALYTDITTLIPSYYINMPVRLWMYVSANNISITNQYVAVGLDNLGSTTSNNFNRSCGLAFAIGGAVGKCANTRTAFLATSGTDLSIASPLDSTDAVVVMDESIGIEGAFYMQWKGAMQGGGATWPTGAQIRMANWRAYATAATISRADSVDMQTGLPMKFVISTSSGNTGSMSVTIKRVKLEYQVR